MAPGARSKFDAPMFGPEVFRKQMQATALKKVLVTFLGLFGTPAVIGAHMVIQRPGNCAPLATPRYAPVCARNSKQKLSCQTR